MHHLPPLPGPGRKLAYQAMRHGPGSAAVMSHKPVSIAETMQMAIKYVLAGLPLSERFSASALVGLVNRHAGKPFVLGQINPNDALWLSSAQRDGVFPKNDTVQNLVSLTDLATVALSLGMSPP